MASLMRDTRAAAALLAVAYVCLTVLAALGKMPVDEAVKIASGVTFGALAAWKRGESAAGEEK
jgi:hypothetical protein